ncbi:ABC transporter C family member 13-like protein [Drosera capensis]
MVILTTANDIFSLLLPSRIRQTGELLTHIRTLKMYGWEVLFIGWVMETRSSEVMHLATRKYLDAWCVFFWATTPTLYSLFTFGLFTLMGNQLDAATVFTCLALFNTLISPLNSFPWVINGLIDAFISSRRLSRFLGSSNCKLKQEATADSLSQFCSSLQTEGPTENKAIVTQKACFSWSVANTTEDNTLKLLDVSLTIPKASLVVVVGELKSIVQLIYFLYLVSQIQTKLRVTVPSNRLEVSTRSSSLNQLPVGSGKSSLLNAILGEMQKIGGWIHRNGSVAYVPQVPWVLSGSIRENILFGKEYNPTRYGDVIQACALDIDISRMQGEDMSFVGEKGANLSGGQRARLALARAMYQGADIYLLDDVLSAVDAHVARCILHNGILGPLMEGQARLLCTHNIEAISSADMVVVMDKGHVKFVGNPRDLTLSSYAAFSRVTSPPSQAEGGVSFSDSSESKYELLKVKDFTSLSEEAQEITDAEERKEGRVELTVYKTYAAFSGWFIAGLVLLSAVLMQASRNGNDLWLSYWVDMTRTKSGPDSTLSFYVVILGLFCLANSILTLVRSFSFAFGGLQAAVRVHNTLLHKLVDASVQFFDRTPRGRILNRLSSDLYTIDDSLPFILNILLANCVGILGTAVVLSYVQVLFLILLLPFWFIYRKLQNSATPLLSSFFFLFTYIISKSRHVEFYYRSTSRELRRLDSVSRSPIYASFTETLDGSSTIRAFNLEEFFFRRFFTHVSTYQRTSYSELVASLWLSLRLQFLAAFIISFIGTLAVIGSSGALPVSLGSPGLVGLALSYAAPVVSLLGSFLSSFTETEKEMVAVERVIQYIDVPQEDFKGSESLHPGWPFQGKIEFQNVTLKYLPSLPAALKDITFTISAGTQVGVIGRTAAGKSSILNALFRLSPISGGHIVVDGLNIADISVRDLRPRLAVVPQTPFLFQGSLRDNLDPFKMSDDVKIWDILDKCHMKEEVERAGGLEVIVKESGTFSIGQRQLLCLARAFLKSSKVLCLDECTANIDTPTASVLHSIIASECRGMTVITIAHRISTVVDMDEIMVLEQGILVEQGSPEHLLQNGHSKFSAFARASCM